MNEIGLSFVKWLQQYRSPAGEEFFFHVTQGGEGIWLMGVLGLLFWVFGAHMAYRAGFAVAVGNLIVGALKGLFCIERPWIRDPSIVPVADAQWGAYGYSFPSGHTANTALLWGGLGAAARKWWLWLPILVWIGMVSFSRMYLGVHTPLDVGTSLVLSIPLVWGMGRIYDWTERHPSKAWVILLSAAAVAGLAVLFVRLKPTPVDGGGMQPHDAYRAISGMMGFFAAWFIERQYIQFDPKRLGNYRLLAVVLGVAILSLMMGNLKKLIAPYVGSQTASYVVAAAYPMWIFVVWPFLLKGLEKPAPR